MEKYRELIEFAERIKAKGIPEQQYIAEGIFEMSAEILRLKAQNDSVGAHDDSGVVPLFPKADFPEKGYIVEDKGGTRFEVCEAAYVCKRITPPDASAFIIPNINFTFTAEEIGTEVKVIGK